MGERRRVLAGRRILLTRPEGRSAALIERLRALGAEVDARPTIAFEPPSDPAPSRRAVRRLDAFDWVLFTSANGVRFFFAALREAGLRGVPPRPRLAAIGPATGEALAREGAHPDLVAGDSRAEGFAEELRGAISSGQSALVAAPEVTRPALVEALLDAGVRAESVAFYRNVAASGVDEVAERVCGDCYDLVVFTSPSTLHRLLEAGWCSRSQLLRALGSIALVAIGAVTARAIEEAGLRPAATAAAPSDEGIVEAIRAVELGV